MGGWIRLVLFSFFIAGSISAYADLTKVEKENPCHHAEAAIAHPFSNPLTRTLIEHFKNQYTHGDEVDLAKRAKLGESIDRFSDEDKAKLLHAAQWSHLAAQRDHDRFDYLILALRMAHEKKVPSELGDLYTDAKSIFRRAHDQKVDDLSTEAFVDRFLAFFQDANPGEIHKLIWSVSGRVDKLTAKRLPFYFEALSTPTSIEYVSLNRTVESIEKKHELLKSIFLNSTPEKLVTQVKTILAKVNTETQLDILTALNMGGVKISAENALVLQKVLKQYESVSPTRPNPIDLAFFIIGESNNSLAPHSTNAKQMARTLFRTAMDPYHISFYIGKEPGRYSEILKAVLEFSEIATGGKPISERVKAANHWVDSADKAVYLYEHRNLLTDAEGPILAYLIKYNQYFKDVGMIRGPPNTVVTYSFEKETRNPSASLMYRDPLVSEAEWIERPPETRKAQLTGIISGRTKTGMTHRSVAPTSLKVPSLGKYTEEHTHSGIGHLWEFAHRGYEISQTRLAQQMQEVSAAFKGEKDFHVHLVFELEKEYEKSYEFAKWIKHANDHLTLKALEEGLYASDLSNIPEAAPEPGTSGFDAQAAAFRDTRQYALPASLSTVSSTNYKFFSAGVRADLYGPSRNPSLFRKYGIELRDVTRDLPTWRAHIARFTRSIQNREWERHVRDPEKEKLVIRLTAKEANPDAFLMYLASHRDAEILKRLHEIEPGVLWPFRAWENSLYYQHSTKSYRKLTDAEIKRVTEAREDFVKELAGLVREIRIEELKGNRFENTDIQAAIRMTLKDWAKKAKLSSLYEDY